MNILLVLLSWVSAFRQLLVPISHLVHSSDIPLPILHTCFCSEQFVRRFGRHRLPCMVIQLGVCVLHHHTIWCSNVSVTCSGLGFCNNSFFMGVGYYPTLQPPTWRISRFSVGVFHPLDGCLTRLTSGHLPGFGVRVCLLLDELPAKATNPICPKQAAFRVPATRPCTSSICKNSPAAGTLLEGAWLGEAFWDACQDKAFFRIRSLPLTPPCGYS